VTHPVTKLRAAASGSSRRPITRAGAAVLLPSPSLSPLRSEAGFLALVALSLLLALAA
jgi:hypothetical protein